MKYLYVVTSYALRGIAVLQKPWLLAVSLPFSNVHTFEFKASHTLSVAYIGGSTGFCGYSLGGRLHYCTMISAVN